MKIGFIGLGNMGAPMAANLAQHHDVTGFDPTATPDGLTLADSAAAAAKDADVVITMLPDGNILRNVSDQIHKVMKPGAIHLDCSTVDVQSARAVAAQAETHDLHAIDAPVSGGTVGATNGTLTFMAGGPQAGSTPRSVASAWAVNATYAGRLRLPRCGTGARNGASVSTRRRSAGTVSAAARIAVARG